MAGLEARRSGKSSKNIPDSTARTARGALGRRSPASAADRACDRSGPPRNGAARPSCTGWRIVSAGWPAAGRSLGLGWPGWRRAGLGRAGCGSATGIGAVARPSSSGEGGAALAFQRARSGGNSTTVGVGRRPELIDGNAAEVEVCGTDTAGGALPQPSTAGEAGSRAGGGDSALEATAGRRGSVGAAAAAAGAALGWGSGTAGSGPRAMGAPAAERGTSTAVPGAGPVAVRAAETAVSGAGAAGAVATVAGATGAGSTGLGAAEGAAAGSATALAANSPDCLVSWFQCSQARPSASTGSGGNSAQRKCSAAKARKAASPAAQHRDRSCAPNPGGVRPPRGLVHATSATHSIAGPSWP